MKNRRIVVIGSGVLGAAVSYYLSQQTDSPIAIIEQYDLASGASGANLGQLSILDRTQDWHMPLAMESLRLYKEMQSEVDVEYEQSGGGVVLLHDDQVHKVPGLLERLNALGVQAEFLQGDRVNEQEPNLCADFIKGFLYCPIEGKLNPLKVTLAFLDRARQQGVQVMTRTRVTGFKKNHSRIVRVETTQGELEADFVINAAGGWAKQVAALADVAIPLKHHRGSALVTQSIEPLIRGPVVGGGFLFPDAAVEPPACHIGLALIQSKDGTVLLAQATEPSEPDSRDVTLEGISRMTANAIRYFPDLAGLEAVRTWACVTPYTDDGKPCYGLDGKVAIFFTFAGFKGAFSTAPAVGKMAAEDILKCLK